MLERFEIYIVNKMALYKSFSYPFLFFPFSFSFWEICISRPPTLPGRRLGPVVDFRPLTLYCGPYTLTTAQVNPQFFISSLRV